MSPLAERCPENVVKTQIWIAISVYMLVAIVKKRLRLERSLYPMLQIFGVTLFAKTPLGQALPRVNCHKPSLEGNNQLIFLVNAGAITGHG